MNAWRFPIIKHAWGLPKMSADSFVRNSSDNRPIVLCCGDSITPVSYTHLTLPTILLV